MSGLKVLYNLILKDVAKGSGQASGIMSIGKDIRKLADKKFQNYITAAKKQGVDLDKLSEQEIKYTFELNKPKPIKAIPADSPEGQGITRDLFNMLDRRSGKNVIKADFGKPFAEEVITVDSVIKNIKTMKPMDSMKETNKVLKGEGQYKNLSKADREKIASDESVTDHIFERNIEPDPEDYADGGVAGMLGERIGFRLGGIDKARRLFLQAIGAGAAGIGAAKTGLFSLLKGSKSAAVKDLTSVPIKNAEGMPSWFKPLVNRVIKEGTETTNLPPNKGGAYLNRQIVHSAKLGENQGVRVYQNLDDQTIDVVYKSADNMGGVDDGVVTLEYRAPRDLYDTGPASVMSKEYQATKKASGQYPKKSAAEFEAHEAYPYQDPEDYKSITFEAKHIKSNVDDLFSDTSALKQFGTNKTLTKKELEIAKQKRKQVKKINEDPYGEELAGSGPDYDPYDDYADGGVAGLLGERPGYKSGNLVQTMYPIGNFLNIRANAPTQKDYNINATKDLVENLPGGVVKEAVAPAVALGFSLPYDAIQAATRTTEADVARAMQTGALTPREIASEAYGLAFDRENPLSSAIERFTGAAGPLADRFNQEEDDEYDFSGIKGQTAGLGIVSGIKGALSKFVGPKAAAFIVEKGKNKIKSDIGEKVITPTIKKIKNKKSTTRPSSGGGRDRSFDTSRADRAGTSLGSGQFSPQTSRGRSGYTEGGVAGLLDKRPGYKLGDIVKKNIPEEYRLYLKSILPGGEEGKVDESYFTEKFKKELRLQALDKFLRTGKTRGIVTEGDQHRGDPTINKLLKFPSTYAALGTYTYDIDPKTMNVKITDKYDFNPAYGSKTIGGKTYTGYVGDKEGTDVGLGMFKDKFKESIRDKSVDTANVLEMIGNYFGGKQSEGKGFDVDIDIPIEEATTATEGSFAQGGPARQNFAMGRRAFLKLMGSVGAGIGAAKAGLGSLFKAGKPVTKAAEVITTPNAPGKPEWFDALVTRVIREGDDVTKKFATKEREIVHTTEIDENATVTVTRDLDEGTVRVDIDDPTTNVADDQGNAIVSMEVKGGRLEEGVKGKTPAEFEAVETDYGNYMTTPDDFITEAVENTVSNTKDLTADLTKVKMYAKGQKKPTIKEMMIQRERARDLKLAEENPAEYASGRQPDIDYSDYDDYASGGIAKMLGE